MESVAAEQSFSEVAGQVRCLYEIAALGGRQLIAFVLALKKLTDAGMFPEASVERRSSFTSCVGCFN
jgi:hypothetical protein